MLIDEGDAQRVGHPVPDGGEDALLLLARLGEECGRFVRAGDNELRPELAHVLLEFIGRLADARLIAHDLHIDQERVAGGHRRLCAGCALIRLSKAQVTGLQVVHVLAGPLLARRLAHQFIQALVIALVVKADGVDLRVLVEAEEFLIDAVALGILRQGQHAGDVRLDHHGVQPLHDAHALVAFYNIVAIVVLHRLDRLAQAFLDDVVVENGPLVGEFRADLKQRIEFPCEGKRAAGGDRAVDHAQRDLAKAQRNLRHLVDVGEHFVEDGQRRIDAARAQIVCDAQTFLPRVEIMILMHSDSPFC